MPPSLFRYLRRLSKRFSGVTWFKGSFMNLSHSSFILSGSLLSRGLITKAFLMIPVLSSSVRSLRAFSIVWTRSVTFLGWYDFKGGILSRSSNISMAIDSLFLLGLLSRPHSVSCHTPLFQHQGLRGRQSCNPHLHRWPALPGNAACWTPPVVHFWPCYPQLCSSSLLACWRLF